MNLYVLFAIAFGAISGFSEPPVAPRPFAQIVDARNSRTARRQIEAVRSGTLRTVARRERRPSVFASLRIDGPLSGSASPRAPAF